MMIGNIFMVFIFNGLLAKKYLIEVETKAGHNILDKPGRKRIEKIGQERHKMKDKAGTEGGQNDYSIGLHSPRMEQFSQLFFAFTFIMMGIYL